jgi:2-dehydropantoate 2-reductase
MQNGVGTEETLASEFGRDRVIAGTLTASVGNTAPGVIECFSRKGGVALASMNGHSVPPWLAGALIGSGLHVSLVDDYRSLRWSKLLLNMLGAASTTILDVDLSVVIADPGLFRIEQLVIREAGRVMDAMHVPTMALPGYPVPLVRTAMRLPLRLAQRILGGSLVGARGGRSPTMRADLARGKSEVGWTNGAVARAATGLGLPAPVNQTLTSLIEDLLAHPEHRDRYRAHPERLHSYMRAQGARV